MSVLAEVRLRTGEHINKLIKRFLKKINNEEIIKECKRKTLFYEKPSAKRRRKRKERKRVLEILQQERDKQ